MARFEKLKTALDGSVDGFVGIGDRAKDEKLSMK